MTAHRRRNLVAAKVEPWIGRLAGRKEIGLMTCEAVEICGQHRLGD